MNATKIVFAKGESLPPHVHDEASEHVIVVLAGRFAIFEEGRGLYEIGPGEVRFFCAGLRHAIKALEADSSYLNLSGWEVQRI